MKFFKLFSSICLLAVFSLISGGVWGQVSESFESGLPTSYQTGTVNLSSGSWYIKDGMRGTTGVNSGVYSAQLKSATGSQLITPTLIGGVNVISFYVTASTISGAYQVNISSDDGTTWSPAIGSPFTIGQTKTLMTITINNPSVNKIQVYRTSATLYFDDVLITPIPNSSLYSKATGDLDNLNTWGTNTDGSGTAPSNFTSNGMIYEIRNRSAATISSNWVVSGTGSKVVVGDGTNAIDFTIPSTAAFSGLIDLSNNAELTVENSSLPTFNSLAANSTVEFKDISLNIPLNLSYGNLKLTGTGTKSFQGNTTTVLGNLTLSNTQLNGPSSSPFSTIDLKGDLTYVGTVNPPADANSITLRTTGAAGGTQTITGAGNTVRWFRITATTANTILLSTTGGSSDLLLGNATSGGIILIASSALNMNGNDLTFFPGGSTAFNLFTGTISVSPTTDFTLNKTNSGSLGTINFTPGSNTMGSLTLNHTGSPTNTLTIGNDVVLQGDLTISAGQLVIGASYKFTLNGILTNNGVLTLENGATLLQGASSTLASGATGTYNVKQDITGAGSTTPSGRFWYLGSPVATASSAVFFASN
jgi:hypothetical protein